VDIRRLNITGIDRDVESPLEGDRAAMGLVQYSRGVGGLYHTEQDKTRQHDSASVFLCPSGRSKDQRPYDTVEVKGWQSLIGRA
jgi:hypothetical protein